MPLLPQAANTADNNQGADDRSPFPPDDYLMHIVKTEMKPTKAKTGHYLSVHYKVLEGEHKGKMMFSNLNLDNPNPIAVEIANKELNSICQACGLEGVEDSDELLQIPMLISVKVDPGDANWPPSNAPTKWQNAEAAGGDDTPDFVEDSPETQQEKSEDSSGGLPWEK